MNVVPFPKTSPDLAKDIRGEAIPNLANALTILRTDPDVVDAFGYDEMLRASFLMKALPMCSALTEEVEDVFPRPVQDVDVIHLREWLQRGGMPQISTATVHEAVDKRSREKSFHPVRAWLSSLAWDGDGRLDTWVPRYLGADDTPYHRTIGAMFILSMVARIFEPGCKCDYMPVLEGSQGTGKSTTARILGGDWFSDALPDIGAGKDVSQHLRGKWVIEVAELSALSKAETSALKAFLTRTVERYRPAYGRLEVIEPRQCVFIGSTNSERYIKDETGGRRFWPIRTGIIDTAGLTAARDQLFAEAVHRYRAGEKWWPDVDFERRHIAAEQEARREIDPWEEKIAQFVENRSSVYVSDIISECLDIRTERVETRTRNRVIACLKQLGMTAGKKDWKGRIPYALYHGRHG